MNRLALVALLFAPAPLQSQSRIFENGVVNAASFLPPAAPGGAIAQGSIFTVFGENLAAAPLEARGLPLATTLDGVRVLLYARNGDTVEAPLLYVSSHQINAILPSTIPPGRHRLRVQRDGLGSNDQSIKVVEASLGLFFSQEQRVPVAVAHAAIPFGSWRVSLETPARPGSTVTLWGSGLGPITAPDNQPPPATASSAQIEVLLAGRPLSHAYAGRSACCAGLDQINVEIPSGAPVGCVVPLVVRVNGNVSNHTALPITADGSPCDPHLSFRSGRLNLARKWTGDVSKDAASALFDLSPGPLDPARLPSEGACMVWPPRTPVSVLDPRQNDVGETISLTTPSAALELRDGSYTTPEPPTENFLGPGPYTAGAPGGESFPPFEAELQVHPAPVLEAFDPKDFGARSSLTVLRWFGGAPQATGVFWSGNVVCRAPLVAGQFQIPPYIWANELSGARLFAFGATQSAEMSLPGDGPDHGLLVYREEFARSGDLGAPHLASTPVTLPSGEKIQAELAADVFERARGLMQRPSLDRGKGMLFVFESAGIYRFWMLNTLIPLDIVWLDSDKRIVLIAAQTPPCQTAVCPTYGPEAPARYVLELAAGEGARRGLKPGDRLAW